MLHVILYSFFFTESCNSMLKAIKILPFGSRKTISGKYSIFRKGKRFHVFGCHKIHFTEN